MVNKVLICYILIRKKIIYILLFYYTSGTHSASDIDMQVISNGFLQNKRGDFTQEANVAFLSQ